MKKNKDKFKNYGKEYYKKVTRGCVKIFFKKVTRVWTKS